MRQSRLDDLGAQAEAVDHLLPQHGELAGLDHEHAVAGRERVGEGGFPCAGARRRVDDDVALRLEQGLHAGKHALAEASGNRVRGGPEPGGPWPRSRAQGRVSGQEFEESAGPGGVARSNINGPLLRPAA